MPVVEILTFVASEAYKKDPNLTRALFELLRPSKGLQNIHVGTGIEEEDMRWFLLVWDTFEDHQALMDHKDYPKVLENLKPLLADSPKMHHVSFSHPTRVALTSPITEIVTLEVKEYPKNQAAFEGVMLELIRLGHTVPRAKDYPPFAFGPAREQPGLYYFLGGWTTVEHHTLCASDPDGLKPQVDQIGALANYKVHHILVEEKYGHKN